MNILFKILLISLITFNCTKKHTVIPYIEKDKSISECKNTLTKTEMNGVSFVAVSYVVDSSDFTPIQNVNATWITTMPFGFIRSGDSVVNYNVGWQWTGEKSEGVINTIKLAHKKGIKVLVKPHIWITGSWVGDMQFTTNSQWESFEKSYTSYIMEFARVSDSMNAEAFCIGVEFKKSVTQRPAFWSDLIDSIKVVYSGKLTYAANWDNYKNITFWDKLDYIGIDAYFPVSDKKTPTFEDCYVGWSKDFNEIKNLSISKNKKVIFTEFGYRNIDYSGKEPWDENANSTYNTTGQDNAYKALFCRFWGKSWFEGGFLWKWFPNHSASGGIANNRFTPQNKPVENSIKNIYLETNE